MIGAALEMTGVSKTFAGVSALEDAHLSIQAGEAQALMGANGSSTWPRTSEAGSRAPSFEFLAHNLI